MTDAPRLDVAAIDLSLLAELLEQDDFSAAYLDTTTGEIHPRSDDDPVDLEGREHWVAVGGERDARAAYRDMEDFATSVADARLREQLLRALEGKGAFRRFKDTMYREADATTGRAWNAFRDTRAQLRALDWLRSQDLVTKEDAWEKAAALRNPPEPPDAGARLVVLNGMPGVGKSTLAARYAADHPDALVVDADQLRSQVEGDRRGEAEAARSLSLEMAFAHLQTGHDVVVPQLVAQATQLVRFANVARAAGADFVHVLIGGDVPPHRVPKAAERNLRKYRSGLAELAARRTALTLTSHVDDVDRTYAELLALLGGPDP